MKVMADTDVAGAEDLLKLGREEYGVDIRKAQEIRS
jgi:hypothetical protein